ncbi:MAG TPA: metalloprotease PmbA [Gammaproteobacteria bacterium]|nr:metalloprotease PmbA [Gammaproteobacteria bacterium]
MTRAPDELPALAELERIVADTLDQARALGATQAEAAASVEAGLTVTVRLGEVETLEHQRDRGLGVTVYFGHRKGSASTSELSPQAIADTVRAAASIARYTAEDPCAGLADPEHMAREVPDLDLDHPWALSGEDAIEIARRCEAAARTFDPRIVNSDGATLASHRGVRVYGNTHGFLGGYASTSHSLSCVMLGSEGNGMQRDHWYTHARDPAALETPEEVGREAARRTLQRLGARRLTTRRAAVLFAPEAAKSLIGHFLGAIRGGAQYRRASFLLDAAGQAVFPSFLDIEEQPHLRRAAGSAPFDAEGVATRARALVKKGILQGYLLDSYSARKLGLVTTGNAGSVHNIVVGHSGLDREALLRRMGRGLIVTELLGQGVNGVTGDYSRGATGFWVEQGEIAYPVEEITIAGNLRDMYRGIAAVGNDVDVRGNIRTGSILIDEMTIAGE